VQTAGPRAITLLSLKSGMVRFNSRIRVRRVFSFIGKVWLVCRLLIIIGSVLQINEIVIHSDLQEIYILCYI